MLATTPHGIRAAMPLLQMHIDLLDPAQTTVTMGRTRRTFTGDVEDERNRVSQGMEEVRQETEERINTVQQILSCHSVETPINGAHLSIRSKRREPRGGRGSFAAADVTRRVHRLPVQIGFGNSVVIDDRERADAGSSKDRQ